jgi:hypothetical protein
MVVKMRRNQEEAASTNGMGWFITSVVSRTKGFIAYLARWISELDLLLKSSYAKIWWVRSLLYKKSFLS